jgi:hypothetical protein
MNMLGLCFADFLFARLDFETLASRASTTIHERSQRRPVSVSAAEFTEMPAQLFTGYTVRSVTVEVVIAAAYEARDGLRASKDESFDTPRARCAAAL